MEEASALSSRVGILSKQMLDIGTTQHLRTKHGYGFHLHLVLKSAPASPPEEMEVVKCWVEEHFRDSVMERRMWNGQLRYVFDFSYSNICLLLSDLRHTIDSIYPLKRHHLIFGNELKTLVRIMPLKRCQ
jgi:hypothetical protein